MVGLMATSSKRAYATGCVTQVAAPRAPVLGARPCWPLPLQATQTEVWLSLSGVFESWCTQGFVWALRLSLAGMKFDSKWVSPLLPFCWGFSFTLGCGVSFFGGIQHSPVGCLEIVVILEFSQEKMSASPSTTLPSWSAEALMLLNCGGGKDSWESFGLQGDETSPS